MPVSNDLMMALFSFSLAMNVGDKDTVAVCKVLEAMAGVTRV
jgi:hypothetical protein